MDKLKLNLGCGAGWQAPGWIGIDYSATAPVWDGGGAPGTFLNFDLRLGLPFETSSADVIFSSHTLEHFTLQEATFLLYEAYRTLKVGGTLCLVVPDLDVYLNALHERDEGLLRTREVIGGVPRNNLTDNFLMNFYSDPRFNGTCHKYAYNEENLSAQLADVGFADVERVAYHAFSRCPELARPEMRSAIPHIERFSLCVQATKPRHDPAYVDSERYGEAVRHSTVGRSQAVALQELATLRFVAADRDALVERQEQEIRRLMQKIEALEGRIGFLKKQLERADAAGATRSTV